jgi:hypothetical protein
MTISESSKKLYGKMIGYLETAGVDLDDDPKDVWKHIDNLEISLSSKKLYISAILNALKEQDKPIPQLYNNVMISLKKKATEKANSQELTEQQNENSMTWLDIINSYKSYQKSVKKTDVNDYKDFMILSLYVLNDPVRADYNDMKVFSKNPSKDISGNYMLWNTRKKDFVFQDYKTSSTYGKITVPINKDLRKIIKHWLTLNPNQEWLMGAEQTSAWLSLRIRIIMKRLTGKEVGINIIRHARITYELNGQKTINEKAPLAHNMMHSNAVQEQYMVKT